MRYIFFCFYNSQYLDGKNKVNTTPWFTAVGMMIGGSLGFLFMVAEIYYFYILNQNFPSSNIFDLAIIFILVYSHYYFFIKDKKYDEIYEEYKSSPSNNRKTNIIVSLLYLFIPTLISMMIAMKWHHVI